MGKDLIKILPYEQVKFKWISDHYNIHLNGTCIYNNELCEFDIDNSTYDDETDEYDGLFVNIYKLNFIDKLKWRFKQWKFEKCVGYHWSYPHRDKGFYYRSFYYRKPTWLYVWLFNKYYKK